MVLYGNVTSREVTKTINQPFFNKVIGVGFPTGKVPTNILPKVYGSELVKAQVKQLLLTNKGERVMLPNFGISIRRFLFNPLDDEAVTNIKVEIYEAIKQYIPNVDVVDLFVSESDSFDYKGLPGIALRVVLKPLNLDEIIDFDVVL